MNGEIKKIGHFFGEVRAAPVSSPQGAKRQSVSQGVKVRGDSPCVRSRTRQRYFFFNFVVCPNLATRQRLHPDACFGVTKLPRWHTRDAADDVARRSRATCFGATESRHALWRDSVEYRPTCWMASSSTSLSFFLHSLPDLSSMAPPVAVPL